MKRQSGLDMKRGDLEHQKPAPIQKDALPSLDVSNKQLTNAQLAVLIWMHSCPRPK